MNKLVFYFQLLVWVLLLMGCSKGKSVYFLKSGSVGDVYENMPIIYEGNKIGFVLEFTIKGDSLITTIEIDDSVNICNAISFKIDKSDFFSPVISLSGVCQQVEYKNNDTIRVDFYHERKLQKEIRGKMTEKLLDDARRDLDSLKQDTTKLKIVIDRW